MAEQLTAFQEAMSKKDSDIAQSDLLQGFLAIGELPCCPMQVIKTKAIQILRNEYGSDYCNEPTPTPTPNKKNK